MAITLKFSPQEDELLTRYCKLVRRTKSDVIRELVRGLEERLNVEEVPDGWTIQDKGGRYECLYNYYQGCDIKLFFGQEGFRVLINGEDQGWFRELNRLKAIAIAKQMVDTQ